VAKGSEERTERKMTGKVRSLLQSPSLLSRRPLFIPWAEIKRVCFDPRIWDTHEAARAVADGVSRSPSLSLSFREREDTQDSLLLSDSSASLPERFRALDSEAVFQPVLSQSVCRDTSVRFSIGISFLLCPGVYEPPFATGRMRPVFCTELGVSVLASGAPLAASRKPLPAI